MIFSLPFFVTVTFLPEFSNRAFSWRLIGSWVFSVVGDIRFWKNALHKSSLCSLVAKFPSAEPCLTGMSETMLKRYSWPKIGSNGFRNSLARTSFTFATLRSD